MGDNHLCELTLKLKRQILSFIVAFFLLHFCRNSKYLLKKSQTKGTRKKKSQHPH